MPTMRLASTKKAPSATKIVTESSSSMRLKMLRRGGGKSKPRPACHAVQSHWSRRHRSAYNPAAASVQPPREETMNRETLRHSTEDDFDSLLQILTTRQHLHPHESVDAALAQSVQEI